MAELLFLEPFYGGSHKQLMDTLISGMDASKISLYTLPAKKWHWRARTSALHFSQVVPKVHDYKVLFASSVLNLAELVALRPDLLPLHKVIYFHENQLVYPVRKHQGRDFQYGYNQILTCLVADEVVFNSQYNMDSFLNSIRSHFKLQPDYRPVDLDREIRPKCQVLYFPLNFPLVTKRDATQGPLHIIWPHRWEHDKNPEMFFEVLLVLEQQGVDFRVSVLGESYEEVPEIFYHAKNELGNKIINFGHVPSREDYYRVLQEGDVVISTAHHEFFGVAMLEAVFCGCFPLCPNRLVYPEIFPPECLYRTREQLIKELNSFCAKPYLARHKCQKVAIQFCKYSWDTLKEKYDLLLKTSPMNK